jgi:hypothetical protein
MRIRLLAATLIFAAACTDAPSPTAVGPSGGAALLPGDDRVAAVGLLPGNAKFHPTVQQAAARPPQLLAGPPVTYHGGPIMPNPKVVAIYWGNAPLYTGGPAAGTTGAGSADGSLVGFFLRSMGGTPFWNINNDYTDNIGTGHRVANALTYTSFWANNVGVPAPGTSVPDAAIINMIISGFNSGKIARNGQTIYAVFSGPGVNLGGGFGTQYCAYHSFFNNGGVAVKYAVQPNNADFVGACTAVNAPGHSPNGDFAADVEVNTLSHELEEAATDPKLNAWFDLTGAENADKCAWTFGTQQSGPNGSKFNVTFGGKPFLIQRNWKIGTGAVQVGCRLS